MRESSARVGSSDQGDVVHDCSISSIVRLPNSGRKNVEAAATTAKQNEENMLIDTNTDCGFLSRRRRSRAVKERSIAWATFSFAESHGFRLRVTLMRCFTSTINSYHISQWNLDVPLGSE